MNMDQANSKSINRIISLRQIHKRQNTYFTFIIYFSQTCSIQQNTWSINTCSIQQNTNLQYTANYKPVVYSKIHGLNTNYYIPKMSLPLLLRIHFHWFLASHSASVYFDLSFNSPNTGLLLSPSTFIFVSLSSFIFSIYSKKSVRLFLDCSSSCNICPFASPAHHIPNTFKLLTKKAYYFFRCTLNFTTSHL